IVARASNGPATRHVPEEIGRNLLQANTRGNTTQVLFRIPERETCVCRLVGPDAMIVVQVQTAYVGPPAFPGSRVFIVPHNVQIGFLRRITLQRQRTRNGLHDDFAPSRWMAKGNNVSAKRSVPHVWGFPSPSSDLRRNQVASLAPGK